MWGTCPRRACSSASRTGCSPRTTASSGRREPGPRPGGRHPAGHRMADDLRHQGAGVEQALEVDPRGHPEVVEEMDEILRRHVAGRSCGEGRPTEPADGGVEAPYAAQE